MAYLGLVILTKQKILQNIRITSYSLIASSFTVSKEQKNKMLRSIFKHKLLLKESINITDKIGAGPLKRDFQTFT